MLYESTALSGWESLEVLKHDRVVCEHLLPCGDIRQHQLDPTCWCQPVESDEVPDYWFHNRADGREVYEQGKAPN